jgi:Cu(I)/Ag(I) efflux system membrane protein CusA/SilA
VVVRYPREMRDSLSALEQLTLLAPNGVQLTLGQVAELTVSEGPPMLRSDNARLSNYIYVDVAGRDLGSVVAELQQAVAKHVPMPAGYALGWSGQYEALKRASERLRVVVPVTLAILFGLIYLVFRRAGEVLIIMLSLPLALVGGLWLIWLMGHAVSVATLIGFIALAGVAAEFGIIMLMFLRHAWERQLVVNPDAGSAELDAAIREGAVQRVRPKAMTVAVILAGLFPILIGGGAGSEVMQRIAAPMVGGMLSAPLLSMLVIPAAYSLLQRRRLARNSSNPVRAPSDGVA